MKGTLIMEMTMIRKDADDAESGKDVGNLDLNIGMPTDHSQFTQARGEI